MRHVKPLTAVPEKAQSQLEIKAEFIVNTVDQAIQFVQNKEGTI